MTKCPPNKIMARVATFVKNVITGIRLENNASISKLISFASVFAARNFLSSCFCKLSKRIKAAPKILSLMTLFSQSMASCDFMKSLRAFLNIKKKVNPMTGVTESTPSASFQSVIRSSVDTPIIKKTDEIIDETATDTNVFIASTSDVRFVKSLAGVALSM